MSTGTTYGANFTIADNPTPATVLDSPKWGGKVRCVQDTVTLAAQYDAGSYLYVGKVPIGAIPLFGIINYRTGSSTATLSIGSLTTATLFGSATALATTKTQVTYPTVPNTKLTAITDILCLTADAALLTSDVLDVKLFYAVE